MRYEVEEISDFLVIHIIGDMTSKSHLAILDEAITDHILDGFHKFVFNLEKVKNLDEDGIDIFISCLTDVDVHGGGCYLLVEDDKVFSMLEQFGLEKMMTIYRDDEEFSKDHGVSALEI